MDITAIDRSATQGSSALHGASPITKLVAFALVLAAAIASWNVLILVTLFALLAWLAASSGLKMRVTLGLALYPAMFAALFAFASAPGWVAATAIVARAATAALAAVVLVMTTPYPQVFAPVQRIVPPVLGDALLMTYRTFFLMAERFSDLLMTVRLRSAPRVGWRTSVQSVSAALGNLLLYSFDLAQRDYDIMRVRGYAGRLRTRPTPSCEPRFDAVLIAAAALLLGLSVVWRVEWRLLNPYSWLPFVIAVSGMTIALMTRSRR